MTNERNGQLSRAIGHLREALSIVVTTRIEHERVYNATPEGLQNGEQAMRLKEANRTLTIIAEGIDELIDLLNPIKRL